MSNRARDATTPVLRLVPRPPPGLPPPSLDDSELIAAVRRGDSMAATALHDRVRGPIDRALLRALGGRDRDHEEIAHKAMIELVRSIGRFRGECSLDTWVARIAARAGYRALRSRKREQRVMVACDDVEDVMAPHDLAQGTMQRSLLQRIRGHLSALAEEKAWTVILHDICGHDLREIAEITDASVAAAQTRLVRGRRELHERIAADPELADEIQRRVR